MHKLALSLIVLAAASTADAKPKPTPTSSVKVHMDRAAKAHKAGKFDVALTELKAAYDLEPQPKLLYAIAQVYAKLDDCSEAIGYYEKFLAADKSKQAVVRQAIDACKKKLADKELSTAAPTQIEAAPQPPPIEAKPEPTPPPPPVEQSPSSPPPPVVQQVRSEPAPAVATTTTTTTTSYSPWYRDPLGDALVVVGVGATIGSFFTYRGAQNDLDAAEQSGSLADYGDLRDSAENKQLYTIVLAGSGLALVAAGVLRYALRDNRRETRGVAIVPNDGGGLITWSGGF